MVGRALAWALFVLAIAVVCRDGIAAFSRGFYAPATLAGFWAMIDQSSLEAAEAAVGAQTHTVLWEWGFGPLLEGPAWIVLAGIGALLAFTVGRPRRRKWRSGALG